MIRTSTHTVRRAASIAAFIVALILLTGAPAAVRNAVVDREVPINETEAMVALPDVVPQ